jgi:hypothetical protein
MTEPLPKGYQMEELLRRYFIRSGYFTVRGVPFVYEGFDVTDIDIWLYDRISSVSRHRVIVDTKNRSTPKAIERIFWTKGLQQVLGVEQAIVASTEKRAAVTDFGRQHDVLIINGEFLSRLEKSSEKFDARLTEEQFVDLLGTYRPTKQGGDWKGRFKASKRPLANDLGFNAINLWLVEARFFAEQAQLVTTHKEVALRTLYVFVSFIAIAFDFAMKDLAFSDSSAKLMRLNEGLRFGSDGASGTKRVLDLAMGLIEQYAPEQRMMAPRIRDRFIKELDNIPTKILAEYFARPIVSQDLFSVAKEFDAAAYQTVFVIPQVLSAGAKGILGVLLDFWEMDRKPFLNSDPNVKSSGSVKYSDPQTTLPGLEPKKFRI